MCYVRVKRLFRWPLPFFVYEFHARNIQSNEHKEQPDSVQQFVDHIVLSHVGFEPKTVSAVESGAATV